MTSTIDRAEINRRNARKSTGPRTPEGKARSRFNAVKHGCRARLPILPGEDPAAYERRLAAWVEKFGPRDAVELYLVERAVHVSWQLDRADRAEVARLAADLDREAARQAEDVAALGADLFRIPEGPVGDDADPLDGGGRSPLSWPFDPDDPQHPARLVAALESTAIGCDWLVESWAVLAAALDEGRRWNPNDRLRAIRLLGKQPLDAVADPQVLTIFLAGHAMDPDGPDVFAEPLDDLCRPELKDARDRLSRKFAAARAERAPRDVSEGREALRAIVAAAMARAEALREVRAEAEAAGRADITARLPYDARVSLEWLRNHQATCSRALFRTFDEIRKLRRDSGDDLPEPAPPSTGPAAFADGPGSLASPEDDAASSPTPRETIEPDRPPPLAPVVVEPDEDRKAPIATNEAIPMADAPPTATNEASQPPRAHLRPEPGRLVTALALLALLGSAFLGAMGASIRPDPTLQMHGVAASFAGIIEARAGGRPAISEGTSR